nr:hypothetical protein [Tanacetum cinerariifolium]
MWAKVLYVDAFSAFEDAELNDDKWAKVLYVDAFSAFEDAELNDDKKLRLLVQKLILLVEVKTASTNVNAAEEVNTATENILSC